MDMGNLDQARKRLKPIDIVMNYSMDQFQNQCVFAIIATMLDVLILFIYFLAPQETTMAKSAMTHKNGLRTSA
jgi:hypothetical protein